MSTYKPDNDATPDGRPASAVHASSILQDDAFHILQNTRRRATLRYLIEEDREQFAMDAVAEAVAAWEHDTSVAQLSSQERQRVYIALYQSHLPKLDDFDVIDYDTDRGIIEPTELLSVFDPYLADGLHADSEYLVATFDDGGLPLSGDGLETRTGIAPVLTTILGRDQSRS